MSYQVVELECPGCGAAISTQTKKCPYCQRQIVITTFNSINGLTHLELNKQVSTYKKVMANNPDHIELNMSVGVCYLKLKLYDKAISAFEKALEDNFDYSETYFYAAAALLKGKDPFLASRAVIAKIEEYINAAITIEPKGIYFYFWAYIRYAHHHKKLYNAVPDYIALLNEAKEKGYSDMDADEMFQMLGISRPECM